MDLTIRKLITLVYLVMALVVGSIGYVLYRDHFTLPEEDTSSRQPVLASRRVVDGSDRAARRWQQEVLEQGRRIDALEARLRQKEAALGVHASRLKQLLAREESLTNEAAGYLDLLFAMAQTQMGSDTVNLPSAQKAPLDDLEAETWELALAASEWELEESLRLAEANATQAESAEAQLAVLKQAVIELGDVGVPMLVGLVADQDLEVRLWAIDALRQLGAPAFAAIDVLETAAEDAEPRVRESAQAALNDLQTRFERAVASQ